MNKARASAKTRIEALQKEVQYHNHLYHTLDTPEIPDGDFDALVKELLELEAQYPEFKNETSPTQTVGGPVSLAFKTHQHLQPMYSLDNVFSLDEFAQFNSKRKKDLYGEDTPSTPELEYHASPKYDGLAIALTYHHETLIRAVTRGDGKVGEDISHNIRDVDGVLAKLKGIVGPERMEIRGEVVMPHAVFMQANERRAAAGKPLFVNPRNAAAGVLRKKETDGITAKGLKFIAYGVVMPEGFNYLSPTHEKTMAELAALGISTNALACQLVRGTAEVNTYYERILELREKGRLDFDIDGVVLRVNDHALSQRLGHTSKSPRFATAFKFPAQEKTSVVEDIVVQVGRTGKLTPVAKIAPVFVGGVTVTSVTLHNESEVLRKDIRIGDYVVVRRAGDVIPEITGVIASKRSDAAPWVLSERYPKCPQCGSDIEKEEGEADYRCVGVLICPAQRIASITHALSRKALDVDGFGVTLISALVSNLAVRSIADVYRITQEQLLTLPRMGKKLASKLIQTLQASSTPPLSRFIYALGIRHVGESTSRAIASYVTQSRDTEDPFTRMTKLSQDELQQINDIGPVVAESFHQFFADRNQSTVAEELYSLLKGVKEETLTQVSTNLTGQVVVVTGSFAGESRETVEALIRSLGGKTAKSVSKHTTLLLAGEHASQAKVDKAQALGIKIDTDPKPRTHLPNL